MEMFTQALPVTVEQWIAALSTLALAIAAFFRKHKPPGANGYAGR